MKKDVLDRKNFKVLLKDYKEAIISLEKIKNMITKRYDELYFKYNKKIDYVGDFSGDINIDKIKYIEFIEKWLKSQDKFVQGDLFNH